MLTIPQRIQIAEFSQYLAVIDIEKGGLHSGGTDFLLPRKIEVIRKNISKRYDLDPTDTTLEETSNYMMAMCSGQYLRALYLLNQGISGGVTIGSSQYQWYSYVGTVPLAQDGGSTFQDDLFIGAISLNTMTVNSGALQTLPANFTFDNVTGTITWGANSFFENDVVASQFYRLI